MVDVQKNILQESLIYSPSVANRNDIFITVHASLHVRKRMLAISKREFGRRSTTPHGRKTVQTTLSLAPKDIGTTRFLESDLGNLSDIGNNYSLAALQGKVGR